MKFLLLTLLFASLMSCSGQKSTDETSVMDTGAELSEDGADIFGEDFEEETGDVAELTDDSGSLEADSDFQEAPLMEEEAYVEPAAMPQESAGGYSVYTVNGNETLMLISFKIYGDYERWREIAQLNSDQLGANYSLSSGMQLKYQAPVQKFEWNPSGNPYLIRRGDTLGTISQATYGMTKYWRNIWDNNRPLIKNPNKIFTGFTIYTPVLDTN